MIIDFINGGGISPADVQSMIDTALVPYWDSGETKDYVDENEGFDKGDAEYSLIQKGSSGTAFGASSLIEGTSTTNAKSRGITSASTDAEIIAEWSASTPDTDKFALTKGEAAHAEGHNNLALGNHSHAEGNGCIAADNSSHAEGTGAAAMGKYAHAEGLETVATGSRSHTEGAWTKATQDEAHAEGQYSEAKAKASHAEGYLSQTSREGKTENDLTPHAQGGDSSSWKNACSHAEGNATIAQGLGAHAEGEKTFANERATHAEGCGTVVNSEYSHAEGKATTAGTGHDIGTAAHAEGEQTEATAWASHAEGYQAKAIAWVSHAEGAKTLAGTGSQPTAYNDDTEGRFTHAEGNGSWAKGSASHAEGRHTQALKKYDHAEGWGTTANGIAAHAEGEDTQANAECSHAEGWQTRTSNDCEHAEGAFNISHSASTTFGDSGNTIHSIGVGDSTQRKNAVEVMQNGDVYVKGIGGYDGEGIGGGVYSLQSVIGNYYTKSETDGAISAATADFVTSGYVQDAIAQIDLSEIEGRIEDVERVTSIALNDLNSKKVESATVTTIWKGSQADYDLISPKDPATLYIIV